MPRTMKTYFLQFCSLKCVLSIFIYNIAIQNTDFSVLQKSSKHFLISIFFHKGRGDTPLPDPPPARHFVPRTRASPLFGTIHAPPSTKSCIRHCCNYIMALYGTTMDETLYIYTILTKIAQAKKYPRMNNAQAVWVTPIVLNILKQSPPLPVPRRLSPTIPFSGILSRSQAFSSRSLAFSSR